MKICYTSAFCWQISISFCIILDIKVIFEIDLDWENKVALNQSELVWSHRAQQLVYILNWMCVCMQKPSRPDFAFAIALRAAKHLFPSTNNSTHVYIHRHTHDMQRAKQHCQWAARARGRDTSNGIIHDFHRIVPGGLPSNKAQGLPPGVYITTPAAECMNTKSLTRLYTAASTTAGIYFPGTKLCAYTKHGGLLLGTSLMAFESLNFGVIHRGIHRSTSLLFGLIIKFQFGMHMRVAEAELSGWPDGFDY